MAEMLTFLTTRNWLGIIGRRCWFLAPTWLPISPVLTAPFFSPGRYQPLAANNSVRSQGRYTVHNPYSKLMDTLLISLLNCEKVDAEEPWALDPSLDDVLPDAPKVIPKIMPPPPPLVLWLWFWYHPLAADSASVSPPDD